MRNMHRYGLLVLLLGFSSGIATASFAADKTQAVKFKPGASSATISGSIKGYDGVRYTLGARADQVMSVRLKPSKSSCYFNVLPPDSDEAIFIGSTSGNEFSGTLGVSGDYVIQVYLMRNAARRNETCKYSLTIGITGGGAAASEGSAAMPSQDEQACLQAVSKETNNGDVVLLRTETSEANDAVYVGVGPKRAEWRCLVSKGVVAEVMSMTDEGAL